MATVITRRAFALLGTGLPSAALARHLVHYAASHARTHERPLHRASHRKPSGAVLPLIVLDPGHGGKDPGATGVSGVHEKTITLAMARELQRQLLLSRLCRVELTRTRDVFIPLSARVAFAQARSAALFVSMHADIAPDPQTRGASVYTLSDTASDAQAAELAQRENNADRFGGPRFQDQPPVIANILASLVRQETRIGSVYLQHDIVKAFMQEVRLLPHPARHAHFMVLRAADVPSVLVEMGCLSNSRDNADLNRRGYRERLAIALRQGVAEYLESEARGFRAIG